MGIDKLAQDAAEGGRQSDLVWGVEAIAAVINRTPRQANHMLAGGLIPPAQKVGSRWVVSRSALEQFFAGGSAYLRQLQGVAEDE